MGAGRTHVLEGFGCDSHRMGASRTGMFLTRSLECGSHQMGAGRTQDSQNRKCAERGRYPVRVAPDGCGSHPAPPETLLDGFLIPI